MGDGADTNAASGFGLFGWIGLRCQTAAVVRGRNREALGQCSGQKKRSNHPRARTNSRQRRQRMDGRFVVVLGSDVGTNIQPVVGNHNCGKTATDNQQLTTNFLSSLVNTSRHQPSFTLSSNLREPFPKWLRKWKRESSEK